MKVEIRVQFKKYSRTFMVIQYAKPLILTVLPQYFNLKGINHIQVFTSKNETLILTIRIGFYCYTVNIKTFRNKMAPCAAEKL